MVYQKGHFHESISLSAASNGKRGLAQEYDNGSRISGSACEKVDTVNMDRVKADISRFISDPERLSIWSPKYFHDLSNQLKLDATAVKT